MSGPPPGALSHFELMPWWGNPSLQVSPWRRTQLLFCIPLWLTLRGGDPSVHRNDPSASWLRLFLQSEESDHLWPHSLWGGAVVHLRVQTLPWKSGHHSQSPCNESKVHRLWTTEEKFNRCMANSTQERSSGAVSFYDTSCLWNFSNSIFF